MKKYLKALIPLLLVIILVLLVVLGRGRKPPEPLQLVPAQTALLLQVKDSKAIWNELKDTNFAMEVQKHPFWERYVLGKKEKTDKSKVTQLEEDSGLSINMDVLMEVFGEEAIVALDFEDGILKYNWLVVSKVTIKAKLVEAVKRWADVHKTDFYEVKYKGQKLFHNDEYQIAYTFFGDVGVVSNRLKNIKQVVNIYVGDERPAFSDKNLVKSMIAESPYGESVQTRFYFDFDVFNKKLRTSKFLMRVFPLPIIGKIPDMLSSYNALWMEGNFENGFNGRRVVLYKPGKSPIKKGMVPTELQRKVDLPSYCPEDTLMYVADNYVDWLGKYRAIKGIVDSIPGVGKAVDSSLASFEYTFDLTIEDDLLANLGPRAGFAIGHVDFSGWLPVVHMYFFFDTSNIDQLEAALNKITDRIGELTSIKGYKIVSDKQENYKGTEIRGIRIVGVPLTPSYALVGDYLIVGTTRNALKQVVDIREGTLTSMEKKAILGQREEADFEFVSNFESGWGVVDGLMTWIPDILKPEEPGIIGQTTYLLDAVKGIRVSIKRSEDRAVSNIFIRFEDIEKKK